MNGAWAVRLDAADWRAAAELRLHNGVRGCLIDAAIWLRGDALTEKLGLALRKLGGQCYMVSASGELRQPGERTPCGVLPAGAWSPLGRLIVPKVQVAALPGQRPPAVTFSLVRGGAEREANVLQTTLPVWANYALGASLVRLKRLSFAADAQGNALIWGSPLPSIPGQRYVAEKGVAAPCGFDWRPRIDAKIVAALLGLSPGDLALLDPEGGCEVIEATSFVAASRSAVRLTLQEARP